MLTKEWTFKVFVDQNGSSDFLIWRKELSPKARQRMDQIINYMEFTKDWTQTAYFRPLTGYAGICEIRFIVSNTQYRPLGCRGPDPGMFTLLVGAKEQGDEFVPKGAPDLATRRRAMVLTDRRYIDDY